MTIAIKHAFVSLKGDGTDVTQVQPSAWNAAHSFTLATGNLVGRLSAGAGNAEEIPITAFMASLLTAPDAPTLAGLIGIFSTGDVKYTFAQAAPAGWVLLSAATNTIGNASSGASLRANADTQSLFTTIYNGVSDTYAPVSGGRSGNAVNDFNAGKTITIPNLIGRAPVGAGPVTSWAAAKSLGQNGGVESYSLLRSDLPNVAPTATFTGNSSGQSFISSLNTITQPVGGGSNNNPVFSGNLTNVATPTGSVTVQSLNGGVTQTAFSLLQPFVSLSAMVKL